MKKKVSIFKFGLIFLASLTINIWAAKPTVKISASPATIVIGSSLTLTWTSTGATSATINQGIGSVAVSGSRVVSPTATTTYTITVKNSSGSTTAKATVTVKAAPPTVSFSAAPATIPPGSSATLSWTTTNATSASIDQSIGTVTLSGSKVVKPTTTKTYTITVKGSGGTVTAKATVTVVVAPPAVAFSATPDIITPGSSSTLRWTTTGATSVSIDQGIGTVVLSGSKTVTPSETITYILTATGSGGTTTRGITITVAEPPTVTFSAAPMSIKSGESAALAWTSTDATTAAIDNTIGIVPVNGSIQVNPVENTTYIITVSGPGGTVTAQTTVYISNGKKCYAYVPNSSVNNVAVIDTASNAIIKTIPTSEGPMGVAISQDGTRVFVSSIYGTYQHFYTVDTAANAAIYVNDPQYINIGAQFLAVDATRKYLYGASIQSFWESGGYTYVSVLFVFDMVQNEQIKCLFIPGKNQGSMVLHPDHTRLYLSKPEESAILCLDTAKLHRPKPDGATYEYLTDEAIATIPINYPNSLTISPDGNRLYAAGSDCIVVLDTNSNTILNTIEISGGSQNILAMHPEGHELYAVSYNMVQAIDTVTNTITKTLNVETYGTGMNVHPDGSRLYIVGRINHNVYVIDSANLKLIATIPIKGSPEAYGNFVGYISEFIAGKVTQDDVGQAGVKVMVANTEGSEAVVTDASGNYITAVKKGTYTVTPEKVGYTFFPDHKQIVVDQAVSGCDFTATVSPAPTVSISAQPTKVSAGQPTIITWSSTAATSATLDNGIGDVPVNGSKVITPAATTTYRITVMGPGGTASANAMVTVSSLPVPTVIIAAVPATTQTGGSSTLTWSSTNATSASIDNDIGSVPVNGSRVVTLTATTTFKITVTGPGGSANASVIVCISEPLPNVTIIAAPDTIPPSGSSTLTWAATNATSVAIDQGIGNVQLNGSLEVKPAVETIFTITATGNGGTSTASVTVKMLDSLLRGVWNGMKTAMINGNIDQAVSNFCEEKREAYKEVYTDLLTQLPQIAQEMGEMEFLAYKENMAIYRIKRNDIIQGEVQEISYRIFFVFQNDKWLIYKY